MTYPGDQKSRKEQQSAFCVRPCRGIRGRHIIIRLAPWTTHLIFDVAADAHSILLLSFFVMVRRTSTYATFGSREVKVVVVVAMLALANDVDLCSFRVQGIVLAKVLFLGRFRNRIERLHSDSGLELLALLVYFTSNGGIYKDSHKKDEPV